MVEKQNIKLIFMGSDDFSVPILLKLIKEFNVVGIITESDKPAGRKKVITAPPTKAIAEQHQIPCFQPEKLRNNQEIINQVNELKPDVIITAAYGQIVPLEILNLPPHGCLNVHPSLLPKYRGASPIQSALLNGDTVTGTSIIIMDEGLDSGDIIGQERVEIESADNAETMKLKLSLASADLLTRLLPRYINGDITPHVQDDQQATFCQKIQKEDGRIDWRNSAEVIWNKIRAYSGWPGAYTCFNGEKLDILEAALVTDVIDEAAVIGMFVFQNKKAYVRTGQGLLEILSVKLAGKNITPIKDFLNGHSAIVNSVLPS